MSDLRRMTYEGEEYALALSEHGMFTTCLDCPFEKTRYTSKSCPWDNPDEWAPEYHCRRGTWVPMVRFLKHRLAGE